MSRRVFNTTCDIYSFTGVVTHANVDCRLVVYDQIFPQDFPFVWENAWLTLANDLLTPLTVTFLGAGLVTLDYHTVNQIAIPSGTAPRWAATCREEVVAPPQATYYRVRLMPLPLHF